MDKKILKLSKTLSLTEARYAAALGFDYIGFCFDKNDENYISPTKAKEIMNWLTGPEMVAEFHQDISVEEIENIVSILGFEYIELNDDKMIETFSKSDIKIIAFNCENEHVIFNISTEKDAKKNAVIELEKNIQKNEMIQILDTFSGVSIIGKGDYETGFSDFNLMEILQEIIDEA